MTHNFTEIVGWLASGLLLLTIMAQVRKQWREKTSAGVSKWLFSGEVFSSLGFIFYSYKLKNNVFVVTNAFMLIANCIGLYLTFKYKKKATLKPDWLSGAISKSEI